MGQNIHDADPATGAMDPAEHAVQALDPNLLICPGGHSTHVLESIDPTLGLYVPGAHGPHAVPLGPVKPGLHVQFRIKLDMAGEEVLGGHWLSMPVQHQVFGGQGVQVAFSTPW